jgi:D-alanyl-D-alanine carboxypeptidase (penicillin-binding protein 5/6)
MRRFAMRLLVSVFFAFVCLSAAAQSLQPPEIAARSYLLLDVTASQTLVAKEADKPVEPGALTKLMSAYLVFDAVRSQKLDLKQTLPVSARAAKMPGPRMFINTGMQVPVEDLIKGMVVRSGNDATMALAEAVAGTAEHFVYLMNEQAKAFGMQATTYKNAVGLVEPGHSTTAHDLGILATRLLTDFPGSVGYYALKSYRYPGTPAANDANRNLLLLRDPTVDGLETAYTDASGFGMVASAQRAFHNLAGAPESAEVPAAPGSRRLVAVVLGAANENARAYESQKLLNWGFTAFEAVKLFEANQAVVRPNVWKGSEAVVQLGRPQAIVVAVPKGTASKISTQVVRSEPLVAPFVQGQQVGVLRVSVGGQPLVDVPLLVLEAVDQAGLVRRAWDALRLWIR